MDFDKYLDYKLHSALEKVSLKFNRTKNFTLKDCISLLSDYGMSFETSLLDVSRYVPQKGNDFSSIEAFTKGFIKGEDSHIIVVVREHRLDIFVLEFKHYLLSNYFSLNIDNSIMDILYQLECMKSIDK